MKFIPVAGATGNYDTDFAAKANAAAREFYAAGSTTYIFTWRGPTNAGTTATRSTKFFR